MNLRRASFLALAALASMVALLAAPQTRAPILSWVGHALVVDELPLRRADVVVVAVDAGASGLLEAADLVRGGIATRVAAPVSPLGKTDLELRKRGAPVEDRQAVYRKQLTALGVASIVPIPPVVGTEDQARVLPGWCDEHEFRSVVVVTSWHHSRRVQRILERAMKGHQTTLTVRVARHSDFKPDSWWQDRNGVRTVVVELQKLAVDIVRHPFA